jgi:mRNA interferase YafQ
MRTISRSGRFKRDYKRLKAGPLGAKLDELLREALALLAADLPLPERFRDHALAGEWKGYRDCHIRPDLVLIYRKPDDQHIVALGSVDAEVSVRSRLTFLTLELIRLGSHSELGL